MKQLKKIFLCTALLSMIFMFSACGNNTDANDDNNMKTEDAASASATPKEDDGDEVKSTDEADKKRTENPGTDGNDDSTAGDVVDDVGDAVEDGVDDVIDGAEDVADDITGNMGDGTVTPAPTTGN